MCISKVAFVEIFEKKYSKRDSLKKFIKRGNLKLQCNREVDFEHKKPLKLFIIISLNERLIKMQCNFF